MIRRGEVYWTDLRGATGAEMRKVRPCVVVSNDDHNEMMATVTVVPLSSGLPAGPFDESPVPADAFGDGRPARAKAHQVRAVDKRRLGGRMGAMPEPVMRALDSALIVHFGLDDQA